MKDRMSVPIVDDFQAEPMIHRVLPRRYTGRDRLEAVDKHLAKFMEKVGIEAPLHPIQEKLRYLKKESGYKVMNYAIALLCTLGDHEQLHPFLPQSNVAWARSSKYLHFPPHAEKAWLRNLLKNPKRLGKRQQVRLQEQISRLRPEHLEQMKRLQTDCHGNARALYRYTSAVLKLY